MNIIRYNKIFKTVIFTVFLSANAYAKVTEFIGATSLNDQKLENLKITGNADLKSIDANKVEVIGPLHFNILNCDKVTVIGNTEGSYGKFNKLKVTGKTALKDCQAENVEILGSLKAKKLKISEELAVIGAVKAKELQANIIHVTANQVLLKDSNCEKIVIKNNSAEMKAQKLELKNTIINGSVVFESGRGKIKMDKISKINGQVTGAIITED